MKKEELKARRRHLAQENRKYTQDFVAVPENLWPKKSDNVSRSRVFRSRDFLVQICFEHKGGGQRITVNRTELDRDGNWKDGITWEELQRIKFQCGFGDAWAVEVFPCESQVVNDANMRHLWIVPRPEFAWVS